VGALSRLTLSAQRSKPMRAVVDTNILIDHLRGIEAARAELARYAPPLISPITWAEVMAGASDDNECSQLRQFSGPL
jgi:predicted nucleic acid-binding protein